MDPNVDIDFVDFSKIFPIPGRKVSITADEWPLEVIVGELWPRINEWVKNPSTFNGALSRLLISMQWVNIISSLTSGGNPDSYFNAEDFLRVMKSNPIAEDRLTIKSLNEHLEWVENQYKSNFVEKERLSEEMSLGRLEEQRIIKLKESNEDTN